MKIEHGSTHLRDFTFHFSKFEQIWDLENFIFCKKKNRDQKEFPWRRWRVIGPVLLTRYWYTTRPESSEI